jgi:alpha-glucosidase
MNQPRKEPFLISLEYGEGMLSESDQNLSGFPAWWQKGVIYQIYPRSFQDSNGDGIGDLNGIRSRLDYLVELGVDAVWLSPIFTSPMADFGYDVADYCGIDPMFGTLEDFGRLLALAHSKGLKLILDFVPNHTSDQHPWFIESRCSGSSAKRDWYIWRDPKSHGGPPNNWLSEFGGSAWTFDEASGQYYYHAYLSQQPDLNWRNPEVRAAMGEVLRFWLARGVDGFRVDAIHHLFEDAQLGDNPVNPDWHAGMPAARSLIHLRTMDQPEVHDAIGEMRRVADEYDDRLLIGEAYLPIDRLMAYYGVNLAGFHLPFNFHLISTPWEPAAMAGLIEVYERALPPGAWPNWVLGNHDRSRVATRLGRDQARVAAMLLLTLRGTPTIYQGE